MAASNPIKLRKEALDLERSKSSAPKKSARKSSYGASPRRTEHTTPQALKMYNGPASILKSGKTEKRRPKTADRTRTSYQATRSARKSRQAENPEHFANSAMPGMNFSPY